MTAIKKCPVCKATLFEDVDTCYGCMYTFGSNPEIEAEAQAEAGAEMPNAIEAEATGPDMPEPEAPADLFNEFLIELDGFLGKFIADRKIHVH